VVFGYQFRRYGAPRLRDDSITNVLLSGVGDRYGIRFVYQIGF
jgi:hypothetical protein